MFVCHGLGGIITKEALRLSRRADYQHHFQGLFEHTSGVVFMGTPHRGSTWAPWGTLARNLAKYALQSPSTSALGSFEVDSAALQLIADEFSAMIGRELKVFSFREVKPMSGVYGLHGMVCTSYPLTTKTYNVTGC